MIAANITYIVNLLLMATLFFTGGGLVYLFYNPSNSKKRFVVAIIVSFLTFSLYFPLQWYVIPKMEQMEIERQEKYNKVTNAETIKILRDSLKSYE